MAGIIPAAPYVAVGCLWKKVVKEISKWRDTTLASAPLAETWALDQVVHGCGSVGRSLLTPEIRSLNPDFGKNFTYQLYIDKEKTKIKKKRPGKARFKKHWPP